MDDYIVLWNTSQHEISLEDLKMDSQLIWLLASLLTFISWAIYITFYNSRVFGLFLTRLINRWLIKCGYFKVGSISINPLAGKLMFRDIVYICADYSIRIQDGYIIFRWWRSYVPKDVSEDLSYSDTRLSLTLNGFEVHIYNRSQLYNNLEHTFGLNPSLLIPTESMSVEETDSVKEQKFNRKKMKDAFKNVKRSEAMTVTSWRDLIPVTKIDISTGRFVLGNRVTPTTLTIAVEEAHCVYSTKPAACVLDHFMHFVKAKIENAKVLFAPSLKYTGLADEPPRYMGEGFVVMMSNLMELYLYMDEPGTVPEQPVQLTLANGDVIESVPPVFGMDIKCGKGTDFSYGPWADRQRDHLFKFFFPPDWQEMKSNEPLKAGDIRQYQSFDISLCTLNEATLDVLFSKEKETNAMHVTVGAGSCIEVTIPWIVEQNGYTVEVSGQLLHMEATTSLQYRSLSECESLEYKICVHYPKRWNECQDWKINLTGCKATTYLIYKHKSFFQDLIADWSSKSRSDIFNFVPYVCKINILLKEFEILTISNEYNWIDCSSANQENHHLAFCGDLFDLSFVLPFNDFLPKTLTLQFWIHGEGIDLRFYLPETSTSRTVALAIDQNAKIQTRSGKIKNRLELYSKKWRKICMQRSGWIDCWSVPIIALSIQYTYHPMPLLGPDPQADITTPEKEEILLSPMRIPKVKKSPIINWQFDPAQLPADKVVVELEIGSSILMAYGSVLRNFIHLKENIFGEDQTFTDMEESSSKIRIKSTSSNKDIFLTKYSDIQSVPNATAAEEIQKQLDPREYRPLDVVVSVTLHDIQAYLMKNCNENEHCPVVLIERLGFEMKKTFLETQLQVLTSPSYLLVTDEIIRQNREKHLKQGHIMLSALQVRGHAMFSNQGRRIEDETLEYAWLLEIQLGKLSAKLSLPQLCNILIALETFVFLTVDHENRSKTAKLVQECHHGISADKCSQTNELIKYRCPSSEDIKYKMTRVSVDVVDFYLVESGTAFHAWLSPVRFAICNLHGPKIKYGVSGLISTILFRHFLSINAGSEDSSRHCTDDRINDAFKYLNKHLEDRTKKEFSKQETNANKDTVKGHLRGNTNGTQMSCGEFSEDQLERRSLIELNKEWVEVGSMCLGPVLLEGASALPLPDHKLHIAQHNFLREHDQNWRRLWFLWATGGDLEFPKCGCVGGCAFFGNNRNGSKFLKPSSSDLQDNYNIADYKILPGEKDIGFGESILYNNQLVFHTPPYSLKRIHLCKSYEIFDQPELKDTVDDEFNTLNEPWSSRSERHKQTVETLQSDGNKPVMSKNAPKCKKFSSHALPKYLSPVDVPYTRLMDNTSKHQQNPAHVEFAADKISNRCRYDKDIKRSRNINIRPSKSYVSDSKLIGSKKNYDTTTVLDTGQISQLAQSAPQYNLELENISKQSKLMGLRSDSDLPAVYRASSYASENPSEFFSADEDLSNISSHLQNSVDQNIGCQPEGVAPLLAHRSDLDIHISESNCLPGRPQSLVELDETAQRFHGLVTPVRKNIHLQPERNHQKQDVSSKDYSSESPSLSSGSFISAMSSQEELGSINLDVEVNHPNVHSSKLIASYLNNLAQFCCPNWYCCSFPLGADAFSVPLFEETGENNLTYIGNKKIPRFDVCSNFKTIHILPKTDAKKSKSKVSVGGLKQHSWDPAVLLRKCSGSSSSESKCNEFISFQRGTAACTSFVVKSTAQVNIFLTPLLLEGLQRMVESLIPYMSKMHVATVVHIMHSFCIGKVRNENILKRDEGLCYWSQLLSNSKQSSNDRNLQRPENSLLTNVYEECISTELKGLIVIPKTSIILLQSSIIPDVSSNNSIDNIQDISCVSFLALYIDGISTQLHLGETTKAAIHNVLIQQRVKANESHKKGGIVRGTKALLAHLSSQNRSDNIKGEPILIETLEKQFEELVVTVDVNKIHSQFRRLNNTADTSQVSQAVITAIPTYRSQVIFDCTYLSGRKSNETMGSVMFECGLEGISIKLIKRHHFEKLENAREKADLNGANSSYYNTNDQSSQASSNDGMFSKAESAWRLISKKPPTPRTPKDKLHQLHEETISVQLANIDEPENTEKQKDNCDNNPKNPECNAKEKDNASSCLLHFKTVWFNFASPPSTSITRKIDFTRLDWNLLSTASPAITAWMDPCNRLAIKIVAMLRALHFRHTIIAACLMADALENEQIQRPPKNKKSRYNGTSTLLSKTLQDDPSCQLCIIMQLHLIQEGVNKIESLLNANNAPHLNMLRQGVIVLSRQWKNTLYNPMLFEHQYKNKMIGPLNVTLTFLQTDEETDDVDCDVDTDTNQFGGAVDLVEGSENAFLLDQMINNDLDNPTINKDFILPSPKATPFCKSKFSLNRISNASPVNSSKSSTQNIPVFSGLVDDPNPGIGYGALLEGSISSINSINEHFGKTNQKEDLYFWMAKQQTNRNKAINNKENFRIMPLSATPDHTHNGLQDSIRLLDTHLIFEPIMTYLGVMPQQMLNKYNNADISSLDNIGANLSLTGTFDSIRVNIVVSEQKSKTRLRKPNRFNGKKAADEPSAFLCEKVEIELEISKKTDQVANEARQNVVYISRKQLKKHISTVVNFSVDIAFISQQVNMPLLRLLHQITNMYQNVKNAQNDLKNPPLSNKKRVRKTTDIESDSAEINNFVTFSDKCLISNCFDQESSTTEQKTGSGILDNIERSPIISSFPMFDSSPNVKNRPQSFAQKLRSTGRSVKGKLGYSNLSEMSPVKEDESKFVKTNYCKAPLEPRNSVNECIVNLHANSNISTKKSIWDSNGMIHVAPNCWKTMYNLLELYGNIPEMKTVQRFSLTEEQTHGKRKLRKKLLNITKDEHEFLGTKNLLSYFRDSERPRLLVFGEAKIERTRLLATLSGLKLEAEITNLNSSITWCKKARPAVLECSLTGQIGRTRIVLLEGVAPCQQTVVKITIGKCQLLYSSASKRLRNKNSGLLTIGPVVVDIPQHPVVLHGMMTRSSRQLSTTLQELRVVRTSSRTMKQNDVPNSPVNTKKTRESCLNFHTNTNINNQSTLLQPFIMKFNIILQSFCINAALLPSLQAEYKMIQVSSTGVTGSRGQLIIDLPTHSLSFSTKIQSSEVNVPPEASLALPDVHVSAEYIPENDSEDKGADGLVLRQGGYVSATAKIGTFERCLTTDLLNHLVFVQKVFMKEINEVIQKVYGGEKPVPLFMQDSENSSFINALLFSIDISVARIQLTATTPCSSAVRFETGTMDFHLSNRVKNIGQNSSRKFFGKANIDFNLSLGQLVKNIIFDEAEPEFHQYAFFNTTIQLRNAFADEMLNNDKELVLLVLKRPLIFIQPIAVDKAILVWLNYKNAYEYWTEKRNYLNVDLYQYEQQINDKAPIGQLGVIASSNLSALLLQLSVEDMGICLPLKQITGGIKNYQEFEPKGAVVITLENTIISACNCGSLVSKGKFEGLCLRFADDFETTLDDWKPNMNDSSIMNFCVVSEGTFEVCSHTIAAKNNDSAKWFLNVKWQMEGVDIHLDVNIGKQLSSLGHTLTMLTGIEDEDPNLVESSYSDDGDQTFTRDQAKQKELENLPSFVFDPTIDSKTRAIMMQQEMAEQLKIINDLRTLGASYNTIIHEELRLQELQAFCYKYFRRDMIQKWKKSSMRRGMLKGTNRSQSFILAPIANETEAPSKTSEIVDVENTAQVESGPSRSASLKSSAPVHRAVFSETMRQASLPNTDVHIISNVDVVDWLMNEPCSETAVNMNSAQVGIPPKSNYVNQKQQEPNIDFELNVQVLINSGKCVLHTKDLVDEKILCNASKYHKRERSISNDCGSPTPSRKREKNKMRFNNIHNVLVDLTIFHIPGLDVKLLYESSTFADETGQINYAILQNKRVVKKRASLFAWIMLQSIPEETIISPHILEFLEQTLEPIPDKSDSGALLSNTVNIELLSSNNANYASFPVDVIVYFHMQPSTFRFSCLPISRVECMLQLPSLDIVFSSKRSKDESGSESDLGGVSVTGCLADFNLYIFHPYGGKKSGIKESQFSPLTDSERKDSLSVTVEFVKFHLTRCRKIYIEPPKLKRFENVSKAVIRFSNIIDIGSAFFKYDMRRLTEILAFPKAWYRKKIVKRLFLGDLSVDQNQKDVDDATEANERRKECSHQVISCSARKSRPHKEPLNTDINEESTISEENHCLKASSCAGSDISVAEQNQAWETLVAFAVNFTKLNVHMNMGNVMGNVVWLIRDFQSDGKLSIGNTGYKDLNVGVRLGSSSLDAKGGIVGGIFDISQIDTQLQFREESGKEPYHTVRSNLKALELRLDYMGTSILMCRISSFSAALRDEWKTTKDGINNVLKENAIIFIHADLIWDQLQIMISKSTTADFIKIFYKLEEFFSQQFKSSKRLFSTLESKTSDRFQTLKKRQQQNRISESSERTSTKEPVNDDVRHHRHWQKPLQQAKGLFVSTLTTKLPNYGNILGGTIELHGNNISLACFHGINFKSKSWALFSLREPFINFSTEAQDIGLCDEVHIIETLAFSLGQNTRCIQNHSMAIVSRITRNIVFPPQYKSLAEWFHYAFANSEIDAVDKFPVLERDKQITTNSFERNRGTSTNTASMKSSDSNHNREVIFALPSLQFHFKTEHKQSLSSPDVSGNKPVVICSFITEFEDHIFVTVDADAFFFLHDLITSYLNEKEKVIGAQIGRAVSPSSLDRQEVPKTNKTVVTNAEDCDSKVPTSKTKSEQNAKNDEKSDKNVNLNIDFERFVRDWRHFECKTWHLEPTVRLLSWAGKSIEPYGIDFILNKLGFSHARITIPKWIQRGFMDPLDKVQAMMMLNLLSLGKESHSEVKRNLK